jgi:peptidylprolyl isomerase
MHNQSVSKPRRPVAARAAALFAAVLTVAPAGAAPPAPERLNAIGVLAHSLPSDWRPTDPENTLYMELATGRVVIELAPAFAPLHVANLKALVREKYFDGLTIVRVADDYLTEWEDAGEAKRAVKTAAMTLPSEFSGPVRADQPFTRLPDGDLYAPEVGYSDGYPVARDPAAGQRWLTHCYGMLGLGRDDGPTTGFGGSPFVVLGNARNLDRNDTLLGHVVQGIDLLSTLPRGTGVRGFYEKAEQHIPIRSISVAADVPPAERSEVEVLRVDTATFQQYVEARRSPPDKWYVHPAGRVDVCGVKLPSRPRVPVAAAVQ